MKTTYYPKYSPLFQIKYDHQQEFTDSLPYIYNTLESCLTPIILQFNNSRKFILPIECDLKLDKILRGSMFPVNMAPEEYKESEDLFERILYRMCVNYYDRATVARIPITTAKGKVFINGLAKLYPRDVFNKYDKKHVKGGTCINCSRAGFRRWEQYDSISCQNKYKKTIRLGLIGTICICEPCVKENKLMPLDLKSIYAKLIPESLEQPNLVPQNVIDTIK